MRLLFMIIAMMIASPAFSGEVVESVKSDVFHVDMSQADILNKAKLCMAQAGDREVTMVGNTLVAKVDVSFSGFMLKQHVRSTLTFKAKDKAFKMTHTNITRDSDYGWQPVGIHFGSQSDSVIKELQGISTSIAKCISAKDDDW